MATANRNRGDLRLAWWKHRWLWGLAATILVFDQASKLWIVHGSNYIRGATPPLSGTEVIPGFFNIIYTINEGAAWGLLSGYGWVFVIIAFIVLYGIYRFRAELELRRLPYQIAFGLIIGGIVGNVVDRIVRGHVVDFLDFDLQFYRWPTFNIADSTIVLGAIWLFLYGQFFDRPKPAPDNRLNPHGRTL